MAGIAGLNAIVVAAVWPMYYEPDVRVGPNVETAMFIFWLFTPVMALYSTLPAGHRHERGVSVLTSFGIVFSLLAYVFIVAGRSYWGYRGAALGIPVALVFAALERVRR